MDFDSYDRVRPIRWLGDRLELLDQRKLPFDVVYVACRDSDAVAAAIRDERIAAELIRPGVTPVYHQPGGAREVT